MSTKNNPGAFNCFAKAEPDEEMFVLLSRDPTMSEVIDYWCTLRVSKGLNTFADSQIQEALACSRRADEQLKLKSRQLKPKNEPR